MWRIEDVDMDVWSHRAVQNKEQNEKNQDLQNSSLEWYGQVTRRVEEEERCIFLQIREEYVGRRAMVMGVPGKRAKWEDRSGVDAQHQARTNRERISLANRCNTRWLGRNIAHIKAGKGVDEYRM